MSVQHDVASLLLHWPEGSAVAATSLTFALFGRQHNIRLLQYVIPYLLGFDEIFASAGGADIPQEVLGAEWTRPPGIEAPAPMPTSAPF